MSSNSEKLTAWFSKFQHRMDVRVPQIIAETAVEYFKESFIKKSFNGKAWPATKKPVKRGSLMVRSGALMSTIRPSLITANTVVTSAGSSKVRYARVHNEGGTIDRAERSETFVRNRHTTGRKSKYFGGMGLYKRGTTAGRGLTFKAYSYKMPQRQFMGHTKELNNRIINRIKGLFNT